MYFNVDFVFPYVNPKDEEWLKDYKKYKKDTNLDKNERFRDFSLLKYIFRSVEKFAPYINNIFILVSSNTQIPNFINTEYKKLKIITHNQFIPKAYLPTFNSNTIEMFLQNIPNLSEHFIYSNDDFIFINKTDISDFFTLDGKKIKLAYEYMYNRMPVTFQYCCKRNWDSVVNLFNNKKVDDKDYIYIKQFHGAASPRLLTDCKNCFEKLHTQILNSITTFRSLENNFNQYLFGYYSLLRGNAIYKTPNKIGNYVDASKGIDYILDAINNTPSKMLCINDTNKMTKDYIKQIYWNLDTVFPEKSKFEN